MHALVLHGSPDAPDARVDTFDAPPVPEGGVRVAVSHSSLNYKDGLAVTGAGKIIRGAFPFVPGIDAAGTVVESDATEWGTGDAVVLTGWGTGETQWGGFADTADARPEHLVRVPDGWTPERAMAFG
ncbi:MAG TPA: alcohol dehydrogenase catalytic domain-containing protein, partial [Rubricoccaceae bacterium]